MKSIILQYTYVLFLYLNKKAFRKILLKKNSLQMQEVLKAF